MPAISLPKFNGKPTEWIEFRDLFTALVVDSQYSGVEKLSYLKESLSDEPLSLIKSMAVTEQNFAVAWEKLINQYNNNKMIIFSHVNLIISAKPVVKESAAAYKLLWNETVDNVAALKALGSPTNHWDHLLVPIISNRFDAVTRRSWEEDNSSSVEPPTFEELKEFLRKRIITLEAMCPTPSSGSTQEICNSKDNHNIPNINHNKPKNITSVKSHTVTNPNNVSKCPCCSENGHTINSCGVFKVKGVKVQERVEIAKAKHLCFNCPGPHQAKDCKSTNTCRVCRRKHHTLLHRENASAHVPAPVVQEVNHVSPIISQPSPVAPPASSETNSQSSSNVTVHSTSSTTGAIVLLGTALVKVTSSSGKTLKVRALIDPGSEISCITESLAQQLRSPRSNVAVPIMGVGSKQSYSKGITNVSVSSRNDDKTSYQVQAFILTNLSSYVPKCSKFHAKWTHIQGLQLADPFYYSNTPVDLILGIDVYQFIAQEGLITGAVNTPIAQRTSLGWILTCSSINPKVVVRTSHHLAEGVLTSLDETLKRFWELESVPTPNAAALLSTDEARCENHFSSTFSRDDTGRYVVRLPFKVESPSFPGSLNIARNFFHRLENRLVKNPELYDKYREFMQTFLD